MKDSPVAMRAVWPLIACVSLAVLVLALDVPSAAAEAIKGRVVSRANPVAGAVVLLFVDQAGGFRGKPDFRTESTAADGEFRIEVPAGRYYLIARKSVNGTEDELQAGDLYAYYGGNPVILGKGEEMEVGVNCSAIMDLGRTRDEGGTGIRGRVFAEGQPLERARVILYRDAETIFRGMGYASALTVKSGDFSFNLEPGTYYVLARKRVGEDLFGPLAAGDQFAYAHENPVEVKEGSYTVVSLNAVTKLENPKVKPAGQSPGGTMKAGETTVEGVVRDVGGNPMAGLYVSAFCDPLMTSKPDFISRITGPDGKYVINLSDGGGYFIGARSKMGGPAGQGELLGRYGGTEDHSVTVKAGEKRTGIDIVVEAVR